MSLERIAVMLYMQIKHKNERRRRERCAVSLAQNKVFRHVLILWQRHRTVQVTALLDAVQSVLPSTILTKRIWMKPRIEGGFTNMFAQTESDFREDFRMSKRAFMVLCDVLRPYLERQDTQLRKAIPLPMRIAVALYALGSVAEYSKIGKPFGIPRSTVCILLHQFCKALVQSELGRLLLSFPAGDKLQQILNGFENRWNFPQCAGAIDGTHIPVSPPADHASDYYNRKGWPSIIMQATADFEYKFTSVNIGWPGSVHDARVFANSKLYQLGSEGALFPDTVRDINGMQMPICLLGDAAYPLKPWLLTPYRDTGNLTPAEHHYNKRHSRARMVIEGVFGRLKARFRRLLKRTEIGIKRIAIIVKACVILHNLCQTDGDILSDTDTWLSDVERLEEQNQTQQPPMIDLPVASGTEIRDNVKEFFMNIDAVNV